MWLQSKHPAAGQLPCCICLADDDAELRSGTRPSAAGPADDGDDVGTDEDEDDGEGEDEDESSDDSDDDAELVDEEGISAANMKQLMAQHRVGGRRR